MKSTWWSSETWRNFEGVEVPDFGHVLRKRGVLGCTRMARGFLQSDGINGFCSSTLRRTVLWLVQRISYML